MAKKLTKEDFILSARTVHGDRYGYEKVIYKNSHTKIVIICPIHGEFLQTPHNHLLGCGCSKCANEKTGDRCRLTGEEFIIKSRSIHGDKYDYSEVEYVNSQTKVTIICPIHGKFEQTPANHLRGYGCRKCANKENGNRCRLTTEQFISKAKKVHGSKYTYSRVVYTDAKTRVIITCPLHGDFEQQPSSHLEGRGCPKCRNNKLCSINTKWIYELCYETAQKYKWLIDFIKKEPKCYEACIRKRYLKDFVWLKRNYEKDGNIITTKKHCIYKYEFPQLNTVYIGLTINLDRRHNEHIKEGTVYNFCKTNNLVIPKPQIIEDNLTLDEAKIREGYWIEHYRKQGYILLNKAKAGSVGTLCTIKTGKETDLFIRKAREVHGDKYSYEKVVYEHSQTKVTITCPVHGDFKQTPNGHLRGYGCPKCGKERVSDRLMGTKEEFISKAKKVHGKKYKYTKVEYKNSQSKVIITCPVHGDFEQQPNCHVQGNGCPKCGKEKIAEKRTKWTYEACKEECKKYKLRSEFNKESCGAYRSSRINGWLDEFFPKK